MKNKLQQPEPSRFPAVLYFMVTRTRAVVDLALKIAAESGGSNLDAAFAAAVERVSAAGAAVVLARSIFIAIVTCPAKKEC